jgi:ABC-type nitrate/sulfonate/bicarbonate transport system ATPase subunit
MPSGEKPQAPILEVEGLCKGFYQGDGTLEVLRNVFLEVGPGEIIGLIGPSGCGKSTLFNAIAGLIPIDRGKIRLNGEAVPHIRGRAAYMQQKDLLLPWRTALDNAILGMEIQGAARSKARKEAMEILKFFGLEGFEDRYPAQLSGGMRQRVALMRTILCHKEILLLDEPFGALDAITRMMMQQWLLRVWMRFRPSIVLITHDVDEALLLADRIYVMSSRPATVKKVMSVELDRPRIATHEAVIERKAELLRLLEEEISKAGS